MGNAIFYMIMGLLFSYIAISSGAGIWTIQTLLPAAIATFDFGVAIRFIRTHRRLKREKSSRRE